MFLYQTGIMESNKGSRGFLWEEVERGKEEKSFKVRTEYSSCNYKVSLTEPSHREH